MFETVDHDSLAAHATTPAVDYMVRKDGKPFAILNATPALVQRTLAGFALADPSAAWSIERT